MRALARELDVPPMTVYNYVPSKEALRDAVVNRLLRDLRVPGPEEGTWEQRLRRLLLDARRVFADNPGVAVRIGDGGPPEATRLAEGVLGILHEGGFGPQDAVLCFATLFTFMTGQIDLDAMAETIASATLDGVTRSGRFSRDELFEFGFDTILDGLKVRLLKRD